MPYEWNIYHNLFTHLCILSIVGEHLHHYYCFDISSMTPGGQSCWDIYLGIKRPSVGRCIFSSTSWCQTLSNVTVTVDTPTTKCGSFIDLSFHIITTFSFRLLQCSNVSLLCQYVSIMCLKWFHCRFPWFQVVFNSISVFEPFVFLILVTTTPLCPLPFFFFLLKFWFFKNTLYV